MPANRPETMLVVDDAPVALRVIKRNLLSHGYQVLTATSVADAVAILEATPVDLVITDLKMPKVGGLDLVRHVHANFEDTAVIMITGYASIETAVRALREGAENYLPKPFTDEELLTAVRGALDRLHARREATLGPSGAGADRRVAGHAQGHRQHPQGGRHQRHGADYGRERNRQRTRRPSHPLQRPAGLGRLRGGELRRHSRRPGGK